MSGRTLRIRDVRFVASSAQHAPDPHMPHIEQQDNQAFCASAVLAAPGYAPCPRQGICITYSLLLALRRCHLRVGGMFSRYPQQPILVDSVFLIVPFALHHYTYLIEGADFPIDQNLHKKSIWLTK